ILFEKEVEVGGQNLLAGKAAGRQEITGVTRWLSSQVNQLDIDLRLGVSADVQLILNENPDVVVMATGSYPKPNPFPGEYQSPDVVNTVQVLNGEVEIGDRILFIDLNGHHQGTGTAEFLADLGKSVHMIMPSLFPGSQLGPLQDLFLTRRRLETKGVTYTPDIAVLGINGLNVQGLNVYSEEMIDFNDYDTIVLAAGNVAEDSLFFALKGKVRELHRIGDCVAPRFTDMAITEGHMVGRFI
ncbi:MAG: mycofactocin system FadH/OYE family oxidoreductase 2, partial [Deltaproteobacteria bacterium]|nr:mycofactocin system FadH/OYE family oxidoreductase 2 [Deltaproteobacteria bacterium]